MGYLLQLGLTQLIANGIEENPELEYKAAAALQRDDRKVMEATKDVSSFANSNGRILIYGISESQVDRHLPGVIDPVDRKATSKEWLEQILNAKIRPKIHGLKIHVVTIHGNKDQVVYILEIPKGETAHQAEDKRYYRRHNFVVVRPRDQGYYGQTETSNHQGRFQYYQTGQF